TCGFTATAWASRSPRSISLQPETGRATKPWTEPVPRSRSMAQIDETRPFLPVNIAVLTISDTRTRADDTSGDRLVEMITRDGHKVVKRDIVTDDKDKIVAALRSHIADPRSEEHTSELQSRENL